MSKLKHELWLFCKAQASAQLATLFDFGMSLFLAETAGLWFVYATFLGALSGGVFNCAFNYRWVFKADGLKKWRVGYKYLFVWTGSILLNTGGTYALTELTGQYFMYAKMIVAVGVAILWNYQMQRLFGYRETHLIKGIMGKQNNTALK